MVVNWRFNCYTRDVHHQGTSAFARRQRWQG
jgi:hypothetical protein